MKKINLTLIICLLYAITIIGLGAINIASALNLLPMSITLKIGSLLLDIILLITVCVCFGLMIFRSKIKMDDIPISIKTPKGRKKRLLIAMMGAANC